MAWGYKQGCRYVATRCGEGSNDQSQVATSRDQCDGNPQWPTAWDAYLKGKCKGGLDPCKGTGNGAENLADGAGGTELRCNAQCYTGPDRAGCTTPPTSAVETAGTGGINSVFERAMTFTHLGPKVHSTSPYVMTFDNFVSDDEAEAFISTTDHHFQRSLAGDVVSPVRTSQQAWCQTGIATACETHPLTNRVHERVVNVTGVPKDHAEFFQVLRYEPGQFYKVRHDQRSDRC